MRRSLALGLVLATGLGGCSLLAPEPAPTPEQTFAITGDGVLRIGTLFGLTGANAATGGAMVAGVELAVRDINLAGGVNGVPVELFHRNSADDATGDPAGVSSVSLAALLERGVDVIIGPSSAAVATALLPAAGDVPLISPSAQVTTAGLFSTAPTSAGEAKTLSVALKDAGAKAVAVVHPQGVDGVALKKPTDVPYPAGAVDPAAVTAAIADADAVVLSGAPADVAALAPALLASGLSPAQLWFTRDSAGSYSDLLPGGALLGAHAIIAGATPDAAFVAALRQSDPGVASVRYAAEAYDATVLAALAAVAAGDDGAAAIARGLRPVSSGGIPCTSFGECIDTLASRDDVDYNGLSGRVGITESGGVGAGTHALFEYTEANRLVSAAK
ncbi:amino acid ABC transporter substrate-binding protein [Glaciihabitans arcticus]|uniref:Amino acid ABC transporter substrate-binding protein n=1 Tax=Glaciihabitans arcticus TaxID=2668039 RepID=A0A4Q9GS12_9MICO|nr:ABC transporter substrate-binding protein [Glaciihabitans arcticus]TBN57782.1 amino acid ABC transporter substrate-binding protein [Glaciihabitans arcticus]